MDDLRRKPVAGAADFAHPTGYWATRGTASLRRRDNAPRSCPRKPTLEPHFVSGFTPTLGDQGGDRGAPRWLRKGHYATAVAPFRYGLASNI
jgi:hypothetical protein